MMISSDKNGVECELRDYELVVCNQARLNERTGLDLGSSRSAVFV